MMKGEVMDNHQPTEQELRHMIVRAERADRWLRAMTQHLLLLLAVMWLSGFLLGVVVGKVWWGR
jgi:hypothetical protein